jgi:hypothetical protein
MENGNEIATLHRRRVATFMQTFYLDVRLYNWGIGGGVAQQMAWETRRNGNRYYYTKRRVGNRVISEYHGKGELVKLVEGLVIEGKMEREEERRIRREQEELDSSVSHFVATVRQLIKEQLEADGYKYHKGQWR